MWPFKVQKSATVTPTVTAPTPDAELLQRLDAMESKLKTIHQEWADTLDRLQTWFGREAARRRQRVHRALEGEPDAAPETAGATNGAQPMTKAELRKIAAQKRFSGGIG